MPEELTPAKQIQKLIWSQGDYEAIARDGMPAAVSLVEACELGGVLDVLDVAAGNGNVSIAAAAAGANVVASDLTPAMLELGRNRAAAEGHEIQWVEADAEQLPFEDARFDAALSAFGAMFAPDAERAAAELFRVVRPGGTVGMANWTPGGFVDRLSETVLDLMPPGPFEAAKPTQWGVEDVVRDRFAPFSDSIHIESRSVPFRHESVDAMRDLYMRANGPLVAAGAALGERSGELTAGIRELIVDLNVADEGAEVPADYLLVVAEAR